MGKRSVAIAGVLVLALLVVWLAWRGVGPGDERAHAAAPAVPVEQEALAPRSEPAPADALVTALEPTASESPAAAEAAVDERSAAEVEAPPPGAGVELVLVDEDGAAVPQAEVWVLAQPDEADQKAFWRLDEVDARLRRRGERRSADALGRLRISPSDEGPALLVASAPGLWGRERVWADKGPEARIRLRRDVTLRAQVVDEAGAPLPCKFVELRQKMPGRAHTWTARKAETAGADGVAVLRHVQETFEPGYEWLLGTVALLSDPVRVPVDPEDPPREVVVLRLPLHGSVLVAVTDAEGAVPRDACMVQLQIVGEGEEVELSPFNHRQRPSIPESLVDGRAHFPVVELGQRLAVQVRRGGSSIATVVGAQGPVTADEQVTVPVRLGSDHPVARLRAVDGSGAAVALEDLALEVRLTGGFLQQSFDVMARTDADGRFSVDLERMATADSDCTLLVARGTLEEPQAAALVEVRRELHDGINDLGEVVLDGTPRFVAGRVVDETGAPLSAVRLQLEVQREGYAGWNRDWQFRHESAGDGRFEVIGGAAGQSFRLLGEKEGWASRPVEFTKGQRDVVLTMMAEGAIAGRVLLDEGVPVDALDVQISHPVTQGDRTHYRSSRVDVSADGSFRAGALLPGEYAVRVDLRPGREQMAEAKELLVRSGETNRDPRLAAIDLRGKIWKHAVHLVPGKGDERLQGELSYGPAGAEELERSHWFHENRIDVYSTSERIDLEVFARGYRIERREAVGEEVTVPLRRGIKVRLVLRSGVELPEPPIHVKAVLAPEDRSGGGLDWGAPAFGEERETLVGVSGPGRMKVHWLVERRSSGSSMATTVDFEEPQFVEVLDLPGEQRIEIELSEADVERLMQTFQ